MIASCRKTLISSIVTTLAMLLCSSVGLSKANRLAHEASPYLRQHANNPVEWYPWGKEAFEKAQRENKPILLSVGYSTCHWCHVMERESYSDLDIAAVLNAHFVAIKVDRERRPEVDETFMLATQILNQVGGWPNNVFLTPELKPFAAVTYLPKGEFKDLMQEVSDHWINNPGPVMQQAEQLGNVIAAYMQARVDSRSLTPQVLKRLVDEATHGFDEFSGGIGVAPKFPQESQLLFLLEQAERNLNSRARTVALFTIDNVIKGGIRDHIGGGFHRYAVDPHWRVPHFEKMLYNQALMAMVLNQAFRMTGRPQYERALRETLDYVLRDLRLASGSFATAEDAESKDAYGRKSEGAFFIWTPATVDAVLSPSDSEFAKRHLGITSSGNFNGASIPHLAQVSGLDNVEQSEVEAIRLKTIKLKMNGVRSKRPRPLRDDKVLTGWNALMIRALAEAAIELNAPVYTEAARKAAEYLWKWHYEAAGELRRYAFEGHTSLLATQPDHAYLAVAFVALFDATGDRVWLARAERLATDMQRLYFDDTAGDYVMARSEDPLPPPKVRTDQPVPSGNSVALELFAKLARRTLSVDYDQRAHDLMAATSGTASREPASSGYALKSADEFLRGELGRRQYLGKGRVKTVLERVDAQRVNVRLKIAPGWHVNAHEPLEPHFIATAVRLHGPGDPQPLSVVYPQPQVRKLGFAEKPMALYEGDVIIPVSLPKDGKVVRKLIFEAQACSDKICLNPETLSMTLRPVWANQAVVQKRSGPADVRSGRSR
ncbi:MAG: DUF255 domain-containing protein [Hyphomicrobiaceae bacterium]